MGEHRGGWYCFHCKEELAPSQVTFGEEMFNFWLYEQKNIENEDQIVMFE